MKRLLFALLIAIALAGSLVAQQRTTWPSGMMLAAQTTTGYSTTMHPAYWTQTYHVYGETSAGAGSATVIIEVSNLEAPAVATNVDWVTACTFTLTLATTRVSDGCAISAPWRSVRARVSALAGTGASINVRMGS